MDSNFHMALLFTLFICSPVSHSLHWGTRALIDGCGVCTVVQTFKKEDLNKKKLKKNKKRTEEEEMLLLILQHFMKALLFKPAAWRIFNIY